MRLSDLFFQNSQSMSVSARPGITLDTTQQERLNQVLKDLKPGQLIQGEVIGRNGSEVQIRLTPDTVITAKLESGVELLAGKAVTFEVKTNGAGLLALSPLFENMGGDAQAMKALDMAGLPVNSRTMEMVDSMMKAGLSVDRNSLAEMFKQVMNHTDFSPSQIVTLFRMSVDITPENLQQLSNYQNLEHQITKDMTGILDTLQEQYQVLLQQGDKGGAVELYRAFLQLFLPDTAIPGEEAAAELLPAQEEVGALAETEPAQAVQPESPEKTAGETQKVAGQPTEENTKPLTTEELLRQVFRQAEQADSSSGRFAELLTDLGVSKESVTAFLQGDLGASGLLQELAQQLEQMPPESAAKLQESLQKLFSGKEFQELLKNGMTEQWLMTPDEVQDKTKVERLYDRLDSQLSRLAQTLSETAKGSALGKSITTLQNNLEFMSELNHVYSFVQLPLKMSEGTAHGDLYVYTNKKGLTSRDGKISALLHLDMEHLGPVDVYVAMEMEKVNTHFYLPDEEMLSFIEQHLYLLDERLEKKGYSMNTVASVKGQEKEAVEEMLSSEPPMTKLSQYSFDVRA